MDKGAVLFLFFFTLLAGIVTLWKEGAYWNSLWKKNVKEGELCDDPVGRHLGWGGLINPP